MHEWDEIAIHPFKITFDMLATIQFRTKRPVLTTQTVTEFTNAGIEALTRQWELLQIDRAAQVYVQLGSPQYSLTSILKMNASFKNSENFYTGSELNKENDADLKIDFFSWSPNLQFDGHHRTWYTRTLSALGTGDDLPEDMSAIYKESELKVIFKLSQPVGTH